MTLYRCRHLVEECGDDVSQGDEENITVLHWASINNRIAVASYLIQVATHSNLHHSTMTVIVLCRKGPTQMSVVVSSTPHPSTGPRGKATSPWSYCS